jgi:hypothetical protein
MATELTLEKYSYSPGEIVRGRINFRSSNTPNPQDIVIYVTGEERADIFIKGESAEAPVDIEQRVINVFFRKDLSIFLNQQVLDSSNNATMSAVNSNMIIPFNFILPEDILESYEGMNVQIMYRIIMMSTHRWLNRFRTEVPFYVIRKRQEGKVSSDWIRSTQIPSCDNQFTTYTDYLKDAESELLLELQQLEFHPGENINGKLTIKNIESRKIKRIEVDLLGIEFVYSNPEKERVIEEYGFQVHNTEIATKLFSLHIPKLVKRSYASKHSSYYWLVK